MASGGVRGLVKDPVCYCHVVWKYQLPKKASSKKSCRLQVHSKHPLLIL